MPQYWQCCEPGEFRPFRRDGKPDGLNLRWVESSGFFQQKAGQFKWSEISCLGNEPEAGNRLAFMRML
jgi:hypothetical protein